MSTGDAVSTATESRVSARRPWVASWRSAIRLAARDARRHWGGSFLIMAMIGLPVLIICAGAALLATINVTARESLPAAVGQAQALVTAQSGAVSQAVDGGVLSYTEGRPAAVSGHEPGMPWTAAELAGLTGGQVGVSEDTQVLARWSTGSTRASVRILGREVLASSGLVTLIEGRLPDGPDQVLVTESGIAAGLPRSGRIELATGPRDAAAEIVGVAQATGPTFQPVALVAGPEWLDPASTDSFLVVRDRPVTWPEVEQWNAAGLSVLSPAVLADPPSGVPQTAVLRSGVNAALGVLLAFGLVLETALLAGPAFAVSAARRRRSLALIASNGADSDQVARYVMAQGAVLGGVSVLLGAGLGTALGWVGARGTAAVFDRSLTSTIGGPPLDTYGWVVVMIMVVAFVAAAVSALVPGLGVAGLDVAAAIAGRTEQQRPKRRYPVAGLVIMGAGAVLLALSLVSGRSFASLVGIGSGGGLMIIGALFLIPTMLHGMGRWSSAAPVAIRLGVRDASRARSRTAPAIAAITVVVAVLTMIMISALSDDAQSRRDYLPATLPGAALLDAYGPYQATLAEVRASHPTWTAEPTGWSGVDQAGGSSRIVSGVPTGCTVAQVNAPWDGAQQPGRCQLASGDIGWRVTVAAANALNPEAALSPTQRAVLDQGGVLVSNPDLISNGRVQLAYAVRGADQAAPAQLVRTVEAPAAMITSDQFRALDYAADRSAEGDGAVITPAGADALAMPWTTYRYAIVDPAGPISAADEKAINDRVAVPITVERGYESPSSVIITVLLVVAVALVLVGSLISTALTQVEGRAASTTLATLGATRALRRRAAAAQAIMIALLGALSGVVLGVVPGLGLAASLTTDADPGVLTPVFVIPYAELALLIIGVPLLAAGLAAIMVRRDPVPTRRAT